MDVLIKAAALKKELDSLRPLDREREQIVLQKFRLDWSYHSNHLEGNSLTFGETKALILFGITAQGKPLKDHVEITGHDEVIKLIEEIIRNERPLTEAFIREIHTILLKEPYQVDAITSEGNPTKKWITVGQYKTTPNHVKTKTGEIFRFATPEETPALMHDLLDWYRHLKDKTDTNPILLAAEFHYRFIRIHPFDDGNGRIARILMNFILMQFGYPPVIIKTNDKENYFSVLQQADSGIKEPFAEYIVNNLLRSLEIMIRGAKGESIEEPDDLDKEISLLDIKLRSLGPRIEKFKSAAVLKEFFDETIRSTIEVFLNTVSMFDKFYTKKIIDIEVDNDKLAKVDYPQFINSIPSKLSNFSYKIIINVTHHELNYIGFEKYNTTSVLDIRFERSIATIKCMGYSKTLMYSETLFEEDYNLLKKHLKLYGKIMIESFIKENSPEDDE